MKLAIFPTISDLPDVTASGAAGQRTGRSSASVLRVHPPPTVTQGASPSAPGGITITYKAFPLGAVAVTGEFALWGCVLSPGWVGSRPLPPTAEGMVPTLLVPVASPDNWHLQRPGTRPAISRSNSRSCGDAWADP